MDDSFAPARTSERPFFVVGCPRSGTTLLRVILDGHSRLSIPPESHFVVGLSGRRLAGNVTVGDILDHPQLQEWNLDGRAVRVAVERAHPNGYPELVRAVFDCYAGSQGKVRWGDKTPGYVSHIGRLLRLFPEAQFVHIIRDGREVSASLAEQTWGPRRSAVGAFWWRRKVAAGRRAGTRLPAGQYLELRLEDLIAEPEATVRRLCAFLGERFEPAMLDHPTRAAGMFADDDTVTRQVRRPITAGLRDWRSGVGEREQRAIEALCHRQLRQLGYAGSRWSPVGAAYGWSAVLEHAVRNVPAALRARLRPGRRQY
jgi:hypothetical protein